jgi:omega-6 fatty acid desaturase (delta-12 desaturase)
MRAVQTERELIERTRPFAIEDRARSWRAVVSTLIFLAGAIAAAVAPPMDGAPLPLYWAVRGLSAVVAGLLVIRFFILYHDFQHGALLRGSKVAKAVMGTFGVLFLTPPRVWRETHNYHHAHTAKIIGSNVGSYMMVTTSMWKQMTRAQRLKYRVVRHPLTICFGYITIFIYGMCVAPFARSPKKHWINVPSIVLHSSSESWCPSGSPTPSARTSSTRSTTSQTCTCSRVMHGASGAPRSSRRASWR